MAYRNHPTRYLIVKDRVASPPLPAVSRKRQLTLPAFPCQALFFKTRRLVCRRPLFRFPEAEGVSTLPRSARQALFSITVSPVWRSGRVAVFRSAEGASTHPRAARQHFFSLAPKNRCPSVRVAGFRRRGGACLRLPARPVNAFFQSRPGFLRPPVGPGAVSRSGRGCLRGARAGVNGFLERRGVFTAPHRAARGCLP